MSITLIGINVVYKLVLHHLNESFYIIILYDNFLFGKKNKKKNDTYFLNIYLYFE